MPPGPDTFYVVGKVEVPTLGYSVALAAANPQGINQKILILDLTVAKPSGPAGQAVETLEVRWDYKGPYTGAYDEVHVRCGDEIVLKLDVEIVH